jgi:hypothetical protein
MSAIWRCRRCADKKHQERFGTDEFMEHLRSAHGLKVISVYDGILIGSTHLRQKEQRPPQVDDPRQTRFPF